VLENAALDPMLAFQKAIAVPRNHVASTFKASWQAGHDSLFNSQFNSNMFSTVGSLASVPTGQPSISASAAARVQGARSMASRAARGKGPLRRTSPTMTAVCVLSALLALAYLGARVWDAVALYIIERRWGRLAYRAFVTLMEAVYAAATLAYLRLGTKVAAAAQPRLKCAASPSPAAPLA
jgi:hypothetical protein